ncbi:DUF6809 family protein [Desulfosporosinus hippei]|uniref:Uncharacterized protein n=1 Tax=Desulfosporosinus hippei DSM 8344 TaxID=1121419 RepID=A0A1G8GZZ2_9FIRM|nr:DUF6809 family protein [Desulfosporosinus hippei]SDH99937.1 hypothetical protein SAMN05443529_1243 [Desulfosporosinus hippei DSM 8344]
MKSILEELYNGNLYPSELIVSKDPKYRPLNRRISEIGAIWKKKLSEDEYNQLETLLDLRSQSSSMEATESFVCGFRLGALIMIEVLSGKEEFLRGEE